MKIESVRFVMSAARAPEFPGGSPAEIAVSGRSNVGKSSLLNSLTGRKKIALVSSTPGKTQNLNYFMVNERFHLVDLPGYGFARAPAEQRNRWARMMQGYLRSRRELLGLVQLVDVRHDPSKEDREMVRWLLDERMPFILVATKSDKLGPTRVVEALRGIAAELALPADQPMIAYSSQTGDGRAALLEWIEAVLETARA